MKKDLNLNSIDKECNGRLHLHLDLDEIWVGETKVLRLDKKKAKALQNWLNKIIPKLKYKRIRKKRKVKREC